MLKSAVGELRELLDRQRVLSLAVLVDGARVDVLLHEQDAPDRDPLQIRRATFECVVRPCERDSAEWQAGRDLYVGKLPGGRITFGLGDFTLHRLEFRRGLYVAGFGRAMQVDLGALSRAGA